MVHRERTGVTIMAPIAAAPGLVAHSVLDARFLAAEIARRYAFDGAVGAQLLYRGMNDVYVVHAGGRRYALRAWRAEWRGVEEVAGELEFLNFLRARGFPASLPVQAIDESWFFTLDAPEGIRPLALYEWAEGGKFSDALDRDVAFRIGALFAELHLIGRDFRPSRPHSLMARAVAPENLPWLLDLVQDRPDDIRDYSRIFETMTARFAEIALMDLPQGACHGDFHSSNVHVDAAGNPTFLDFDGCGTDYYLQDVANFVFGNEFYRFDPVYGEAFVAGYQSVRPFTAEEAELFDFFLLAKMMRLVSGLARNINSVGHGVLRYRDLDWFSTTIGQRARALGLL